MSIAMLSIFSLTCLYGIILGVFLDKISWKVVDYKREQRREPDAGKGDDEKEEGEREQRREPDAGKGDDEKEGKREAGKRAKELSLHCADDRSRKLARILLPILHLLLCGIGGGILALNETIPLTLPKIGRASCRERV